jgi:hypothetical protein
LGCGKNEEPDTGSVSIISLTANGIPLVDGTINVPTEINIEIAFSEKIIPNRLESNLSITNQGNPVSVLNFSYTNSTSKVNITAQLDFNTTYQLGLSKTVLGENGSTLANTITRTFTTVDEGIITSKEPCLLATNDCLEIIDLTAEGKTGGFSLFTSYPIEPDNARWESITNAVITIHGLNRDGDAYFESMANTLKSLNKQGNTILISPVFKSQNDANGNDLYWTNAGWRKGDVSEGGISESSFWVLEQILEKLSNKEIFPALKTIFFTGHSSGALMTQLLATTITLEKYIGKFDVQYVVANSQYFYYPQDVRFNSTLNTFQMVNGCPGYNTWPYGYNQFPSHLSQISKSEAESNIVGNKVLYLLGTNDVVTTGTLNTDDCEAVLLGENRFKRGENMFGLLQTFYNGQHHSEKVLVNGVGHNFAAMFQSTEFKSWLELKLN